MNAVSELLLALWLLLFVWNQFFEPLFLVRQLLTALDPFVCRLIVVLLVLSLELPLCHFACVLVSLMVLLHWPENWKNAFFFKLFVPSVCDFFINTMTKLLLAAPYGELMMAGIVERSLSFSWFFLAVLRFHRDANWSRNKKSTRFFFTNFFEFYEINFIGNQIYTIRFVDWRFERRGIAIFAADCCTMDCNQFCGNIVMITFIFRGTTDFFPFHSFWCKDTSKRVTIGIFLLTINIITFRSHWKWFYSTCLTFL